MCRVQGVVAVVALLVLGFVGSSARVGSQWYRIPALVYDWDIAWALLPFAVPLLGAQLALAYC